MQSQKLTQEQTTKGNLRKYELKPEFFENNKISKLIVGM